jgi:hypothetical protein
MEFITDLYLGYLGMVASPVATFALIVLVAIFLPRKGL